MQDQIFKKVQAFAEKNRIFQDCSLVIAGVSGGGDSMAMLDILQRFSSAYDFELRVVHVNHGIRGEEALRDQNFVEKVCEERGISCGVYSYPVPALAGQWKTGMEEAGRRVRRDAFQKELEGSKKQKGLIALAHNKNDLAETMIHHLCRGTGLRGLSPMEARKDGVIRPVLCLERKEIDNYLKERKISFVEDSTNFEDEYTRNKIRHHLLPVMEKEINERTVSHMAETAELLGQAEKFLQTEGAVLAASCKNQDGYLFGRDFFAKQEILQKYAVRQAMEELAGRRRDLSMLHVKQVLELAGLGTGAVLDLPFTLGAEKTYEGILLRRKKSLVWESIKKGEHPLPLQGVLECVYGCFETKIFPWSDQKICEKKYTKWLDYDKIKYDVSIRTRKSGDYLIVNSEGRHKKLTRCMIDEKIPREKRDEIPLAAAGSEILWIVGGRMNERYKITSETKNVLEIKYKGGQM